MSKAWEMWGNRITAQAIQALDQRTTELQQKTAEVELLRAQMNELRSVNETMEKRLAALEQNAQKTAPLPRKEKRTRR